MHEPSGHTPVGGGQDLTERKKRKNEEAKPIGGAPFDKLRVTWNGKKLKTSKRTQIGVNGMAGMRIRRSFEANPFPPQSFEARDRAVGHPDYSTKAVKQGCLIRGAAKDVWP